MADLDFATRIGALIKGARWSRPVDTTITDVNAYVTEGFYPVTRAGVPNRPVAAAGDLEVLPRIGANVVQVWTTTEAPARQYSRRSTDSGATWSPWAITVWRGGGLANGASLDALLIAGTFEVANTSVTGRPTEGIGNIEIFPLGAGIVQQRFTTNDLPQRIYTRRRMDGAWSPWVKTPTTEDIEALNTRIDDLPAPGGSSDGGVVREPIGTWAPTLASVRWDDYICTLSRDRLTGWNGQDLAGDLLETKDGGTNWSLLKNFGEYFVWVREMDNGELLAGTAGVAPAPRNLWVSSGYPTLGAAATWAKVLTAAAPAVTFGTAWGYSQHENIVLVAEYGPKYNPGNEVLEGQNARYAYLSLDHGKTWRNIFDLNAWVETTHGPGLALNVHLHGIAWDPYWDRIWITYGDDVNGTCFSDDLGATWHPAHWSNETYSLDQNVGIACLPGRILFGTDTAPNGVMAFDRSEGKKKGLYTLKQAYTIPGGDGTTRTHLCQAIHRVPQEGGGVWLFGFGAETNPGKSTIAATRDGFTWTTFWQDPVAQNPGKGLRTIAGPTLAGELIVGSDDQRTSLWTVWRGPAPIY